MHSQGVYMRTLVCTHCTTRDDPLSRLRAKIRTIAMDGNCRDLKLKTCLYLIYSPLESRLALNWVPLWGATLHKHTPASRAGVSTSGYEYPPSFGPLPGLSWPLSPLGSMHDRLAYNCVNVGPHLGCYTKWWCFSLTSGGPYGVCNFPDINGFHRGYHRIVPNIWVILLVFVFVMNQYCYIIRYIYKLIFWCLIYNYCCVILKSLHFA